ncbi:N-acetylmuramoyl-L-alanine amidase family protein [Pseudozobellia thermophila]|uniref:N-acetylmuramoyl-L-alanine amidase n=1 Tax=Pseudozobellia thermophila TaxID=192903 RepID=A0A1M6IXP5_9FLAO|nr:N-acetylmuramoyl-L-alanine amidase [Pseudozobellia thermophila]SHJ39198.1 N-acetylmuramoyl-L-alanine amidase [Pseudozobellia thermophila]
MKVLKYSVNVRAIKFFLLLAVTFTSPLLAFCKSTHTFQNDDDKFVVVLDAGHGGHDPGNLGNGYLEKNIALNIVLKAGEILEKDPNIKVVYTRKDDTFVDLYVRGQIANKANADVFVSVHCDSHTSNAHGAGTFVLGLHANKQNFEVAKKENSVIYLEDNYQKRYADYDINSPESVIGLTIMQEEFLDNSIALAKAIQDNFSNKLKRTDRKVKQAGFIVLHQTVMPSVLVETGFLTNKQEGAYLNSKKGQSEMGTAIAEAIATYRDMMQANRADFATNRITDVPDPEPAVAEKPIVEKAEEEEEVAEKKEVVKADPDSRPIGKTEDLLASNEPETPLSAPGKAEKGASEIIEEARRNTDQEAKTAGTRTTVEKDGPETGVKPAPDKKETKANIIYKVQIMASAKNLPLRPESFNGLNRVAKEPYKNLYRYVYGSTPSLEEAKMLKSNADLKGYTSSYIVAYKNGERIPFKESLK